MQAHTVTGVASCIHDLEHLMGSQILMADEGLTVGEGDQLIEMSWSEFIIIRSL